ncbi:MAG: hypothetical protein IPK09_15845 [Candidatus Competibacteraceae bacterium]|nr:hypothetical protein [Candidatus Competibacteraceae bacterium]
MRHGIGLDKIFSTILIYPTLAEANKYVAGVWKKMPSTVWLARPAGGRKGLYGPVISHRLALNPL